MWLFTYIKILALGRFLKKARGGGKRLSFFLGSILQNVLMWFWFKSQTFAWGRNNNLSQLRPHNLSPATSSSTSSSSSSLSCSPMSRLRQRTKVEEAPSKKPCKIKKTSSYPQPAVCICECEHEDHLLEDVPRKHGVATICQAIDSVGGKRVGCSNKVVDFKFRRAVPSGQKMLLCPEHIRRFHAHNLCPLSNEFCTHVSLLDFNLIIKSWSICF